jgi:hypothetical protein
MQSVGVGTTVRFGNHTLTAEEIAAGFTPRDPFVAEADAPTDPDTARLWITPKTGLTVSYGWPTADPADSGVLEQESTGRFYVDWTPDYTDDGLCTWFLEGKKTLGSGQTDQGAIFVQVPPMPVAAAA